MPGIRVHTDIEAMMWALEEFFLSMLGVNIAVGSHAAWPGAFPQRMLVIDEFGTFAGMAARIHHRNGRTGPLQADSYSVQRNLHQASPAPLLSITSGIWNPAMGCFATW